MIHAYAIDPEVAASWADPRVFRLVIGHFRAGTPRAMLEIPKFSKWRKAVFAVLGSEAEQSPHLAELFRVLGECRVRRSGIQYDSGTTWLDNAEREHDRRAYAAIVAMANPRGHRAVLEPAEVGDTTDARWQKPRAATPSRRAADLAAAVGSMLRNSSALHLVDPYFDPGNGRHRAVLEALVQASMPTRNEPFVVTIHCAPRSTIRFFEQAAGAIAGRLPPCVTLRFRRWEEDGRERFHNRYLLTKLGGVTFGVGLDQGAAEQTDDINLMGSEQYRLRWEQFCGPAPALTLVDQPAQVVGRRQQ